MIGLPAFASLFSFGRGRPSLRVILGGLGRLTMGIEASVSRIEEQNKAIAKAVLFIAQTQKVQGDALQALAAASPAVIDTTALDLSIGDGDKLVAALSSLVASAPQPATAPAPAAAPSDAAASAYATSDAAAAAPSTSAV